MPHYDELKAEYEELWSKLKIRPAQRSAVLEIVDTILLPHNRRRYEDVGHASGIPWMVVACIHSLEASQSFTGHLHNGDPLSARTVHVPRGRPLAGSPPFQWQDSAIDALSMKRRNEVGEWSIPACLYYLEAYNGWGYRTGAGRDTTPKQRSPYLWSFTTHYTKGKYVADGRFDKDAVSRQAGAAAILFELHQALGTVPADNDHAFHPSSVAGRPMVMQGNRGEVVAELQGLLVAKGYDPGQVDGVFGPRTRQAVLAFQTDHHLEIDGIAGPETWGALIDGVPQDDTGAHLVNLRRDVLAFAAAEAAKGRSHAPGNDIDRLVLDPLRPILKQLGHLGQTQNDSFFDWCAAWVTYVLREKGVLIPDRYKSYWASVAKVDAWRDMARRTDTWTRSGEGAPKPGDVVVYNWDGDQDTDHIGILKEFLPTRDQLVAYEGNRNNREVTAIRQLSTVAGFIDLEGLQSALATT